MIPDTILQIIVCPECHGSLRPSETAGFICLGCGALYAVEEGVPLLHSKKNLARIRNRIESSKKDKGRSSFLQNKTSGDQLLQASQYDLTEAASFRDRFLHQLKKVYPPGPAINRVIPAKRNPLIERFREGARILNVGSGDADMGEGVINFDLDRLPHVHVVGDGEKLPFADGSFDLIINQAVLEHTPDPKAMVTEMHRVLRNEGTVYVEAPFIQEYHAFPMDFHRFTISGFESLFANFDKVESGVCAGPSAAWGRMTREYFAAFFDNPYLHQAVKFVVGWLVYPLRYLDLYLNKKRYAHVIAMAWYFIGRKKAR